MMAGGSWISAAEQRRAPPFSRLKAANHLARGDYSEGLSGLRAPSTLKNNAIDALFFETREGHFCKGL